MTARERGVDLIDLGVGDADLPPPPDAVRALQEAAAGELLGATGGIGGVGSPPRLGPLPVPLPHRVVHDERTQASDALLPSLASPRTQLTEALTETGSADSGSVEGRAANGIPEEATLLEGDEQAPSTAGHGIIYPILAALGSFQNKLNLFLL